MLSACWLIFFGQHVHRKVMVDSLSTLCSVKSSVSCSYNSKYKRSTHVIFRIRKGCHLWFCTKSLFLCEKSYLSINEHFFSISSRLMKMFFQCRLVEVSFNQHNTFHPSAVLGCTELLILLLSCICDEGNSLRFYLFQNKIFSTVIFKIIPFSFDK